MSDNNNEPGKNQEFHKITQAELASAREVHWGRGEWARVRDGQRSLHQVRVELVTARMAGPQETSGKF
jgi:hypothetical protein